MKEAQKGECKVSELVRGLPRASLTCPKDVHLGHKAQSVTLPKKKKWAPLKAELNTVNSAESACIKTDGMKGSI